MLKILMLIVTIGAGAWCLWDEFKGERSKQLIFWLILFYAVLVVVILS